MHDGTAPAAAPVSDHEQVQAAWNQLNLVLGFFPRIDSRLSAVLALDLGMLALVGGRWPVGDAVTLRTFILAMAFVVPLRELLSPLGCHCPGSPRRHRLACLLPQHCFDAGRRVPSTVHEAFPYGTCARFP